MSLFPSYQVVLFLLSTKDITESYTASRGPSIYSMESDPIDKDENKVDTQPSFELCQELLKFRKWNRQSSPKLKQSYATIHFLWQMICTKKCFIFQPFQIYANTLSVAQTPVALVFCILHLHLYLTEKICCMSKLQGL